MKKLILYPWGRWAEELITISRMKKVNYIVDDTIKDVMSIDIMGKEYMIYPTDILEQEKKEEVCIIITDSRKYRHCKTELEKMDYVESIHFFNGWKLEKAFYTIAVGGGQTIGLILNRAGMSILKIRKHGRGVQK